MNDVTGYDPVVAARLDRDQSERLRKLAARRGTTVSSLVRAAVARYLKQAERDLARRGV